MHGSRTSLRCLLRCLASASLFLAACGGPQSNKAGENGAKPAEETGEKPAQPSVRTYDARAFHETTSVFGASFSHDESRVLVSSDQTGVFNVYAQPIAGGAPAALTQSSGDSHFAISFFPGDDRFLYSADQGGNELDHVYVMEADGKSRDLTPGEKLKAEFVDWSGDKKSFYVATNERDAQAFDLYRFETEGYKRTRVFENKQRYSIGAVSPDGRWVALNKVNNNADSDIFLWDAKKPKAAPVKLTPHEGHVQHSVQTFSRDSKRLYYTTDGQGEYAQAWSYDLGSKERKAEITAEWDVMYVVFSESGRYRVSAVNDDARTVLSVLDTQSSEPLALPKLPKGDITGVEFSPSEAKMAFYVSSDSAPPNLYVLDLASGEHTQLTDTLNPEIDPAHLVQSEVIRYRSFDDLEIPSILYKPLQASATNKVPALVWVHGGPGGQTRVNYSATIQHLVNHGYAVLAVNNRGSSGYGKTFFHMDDHKHGDVDLKDCVWARKYLEGLDWVDGKHVGIIGGSYGGYMVLAALTFEPDAFDLGIDIFGVSNWIRTLESIPPWWGSFRDGLYAEMGDPKQDRERLERFSPLLHAKNIKKPLLVIQGANDPRVLKVESDEIVAAAKQNGAPVEYLVFEDEGHGFEKKQNRIAASEAYVKFLQAHFE
jgi:dipeptidyl aminopeptidase/acylaminoacyl peptidase